MATTCVLAVSTLCLLQPAAYRLGQVIIEEQLMDRALQQLQIAVYRLGMFEQVEDKIAVLRKADLGARGYAFAMDEQGRIVTPHPRAYERVDQERFYRLEDHLTNPLDAWVDRVGQHRVVSFVRVNEPPWIVFSVSLPEDFSAPLRHFVRFSWVALLEVLFVVVLFGRYYTRSITTPLAELRQAARRIAEHGDLSGHVPVTTNDELSEVARSFNHMVQELRSSKAHVEDYTRRLERSTQELSALNQEMEDLLHVVSHDLRAPLINIQGFSKRLEPLIQETVQTLDRVAQASHDNGIREQVATLKNHVQARMAESLQYISKGVEKMDTLLCDLLAVSRVGRKADPIQPHDLSGILDDVLTTFHHQLSDQAIQVIRKPLPTQVPCRRNEINQVFSNLISNAINYMGPSDRRFIEVGGTEHPDHVECYVRDTGLGIAPQDQGRIFNMFTRLQAIDVPGEGIGLAYVKKILRSHGGEVRVVSQQGQGSTFFFTLPKQPVGSRGG
jgi:signal transduction histidine kinase